MISGSNSSSMYEGNTCEARQWEKMNWTVGMRFVIITSIVCTGSSSIIYREMMADGRYMVSNDIYVLLWQYTSQQSLVSDFELMFKNARHYNEEKSQVYKDAETLERILHARLKTLPSIDDQPVKVTPRRYNWISYLIFTWVSSVIETL